MLEIYCPYCEALRDEEEFTYGGDGAVRRPEHPEALDDEAWGAYLFFRPNPRGRHLELWSHSAGCRRFFKVVRDTASYEIFESLPLPGGAEAAAQAQEHGA